MLLLNGQDLQGAAEGSTTGEFCNQDAAAHAHLQLLPPRLGCCQIQPALLQLGLRGLQPAFTGA